MSDCGVSVLNIVGAAIRTGHQCPVDYRSELWYQRLTRRKDVFRRRLAMYAAPIEVTSEGKESA